MIASFTVPKRVAESMIAATGAASRGGICMPGYRHPCCSVFVSLVSLGRTPPCFEAVSASCHSLYFALFEDSMAFSGGRLVVWPGLLHFLLLRPAPL